MNKMYEYLEKHAYISKNKKSNYQFELTRERAECIANKYNSLCEEKNKEIERLNNIIKEVREYIENNSLYEEDYDYDYEENLVVGPPSDETARKILLEILDKEVN